LAVVPAVSLAMATVIAAIPVSSVAVDWATRLAVASGGVADPIPVVCVVLDGLTVAAAVPFAASASAIEVLWASAAVPLVVVLVGTAPGAAVVGAVVVVAVCVAVDGCAAAVSGDAVAVVVSVLAAPGDGWRWYNRLVLVFLHFFVFGVLLFDFLLIDCVFLLVFFRFLCFFLVFVFVVLRFLGLRVVASNAAGKAPVAWLVAVAVVARGAGDAREALSSVGHWDVTGVPVGWQR
jgi:hypothetical protein